MPRSLPKAWLQARQTLLGLALALAPIAVDAQEAESPLQRSVQELRNAVGTWSVTTEVLDEDGSVTQNAEGSYAFEWVIEDRVLQGRMAIPAQGLASAIVFYVRESSEEIEMVSVGRDGRLWVMTGPLGGDTRYSQTFQSQSGGEAQLRFTRFNASPDRFESRMEWTDDGGATWKPGNHQVFMRR